LDRQSGRVQVLLLEVEVPAESFAWDDATAIYHQSGDLPKVVSRKGK